jgi:hypothetical protein
MRVLRQLIIRFMSSEDCCLLRSTEGSSLLGSNLSCYQLGNEGRYGPGVRWALARLHCLSRFRRFTQNPKIA